MATILCFDTATKACSVALWKDDLNLAQIDFIEDDYTHAEKLHVLISDIMSQSDMAFSSLDAIAIGKGPGSYTGLRIGVSAAKGLAYSLEIPLISIPTLKIMSAMAQVLIEDEEPYLLRPLLDARRMEVYSSAYSPDLVEVAPCIAHLLDEDEDSFSHDLEAGAVYFFGDGMKKCQAILSQSKQARFIKDIYPSAAYMGSLAQIELGEGKVEDTAYFEPFYMKEFIAKKARKMF